MKIIGHRGAKGLAPENTLASIRKALEHHVDQIEFDVRVTKDGVPVLLHDAELVDASGVNLALKDHTYKRLLEHKPDLASLEEALTIKAPLYIEVKPKVETRYIVALLKNHPRKDLCLASKSQKTLRELHKALPEIPKIVIEQWSGVRAHWRARQVNTKIVAMNQRWLWWGFIRSVKRSGWELYAYTLNDKEKARRWEADGLAGVITDFPDRFEH